MTQPRIVSVHAGKIAPLGPEGVPSGFIKHPVLQPVAVNPLGLGGDAQADLSVHGGFEKAVYGYSFENYADWQAEKPQHAAILVPGAFGENLCIRGLREADICVGDVHRIGSSRLQVCQPRQPCFKLALRFQDKMMPKAMVRSGRAGWYYRVVEPGEVAPDDTVQLDERPNADFPFSRLVQIVSYKSVTRPELERMQIMIGLSTQWRVWAQEQLDA